MFYPSQQGNEQIQLYENALIKLQGFHSALGEDAQIYSKEEIVREFQLFDPKIKDKTKMRNSQYTIDIQLDKLYKKYYSEEKSDLEIDNSAPDIVLSETIV